MSTGTTDGTSGTVRGSAAPRAFARTLLPIPEAMREACESEWSDLASAGRWWTGPERRAIVAEVRAADRCGACTEARGSVSAPTSLGDHDGPGRPSGPAVAVVHRLVTDPGRITRRWVESAVGVLGEEAYVELVGIVATVVAVDVLSAGAGSEPPEAPEPRPGAASRKVPPGARVHSAWVRTVPPEVATGELASIYEQPRAAVGFVPHIVRALSLAPEQVAAYARLTAALYVPLGLLGDAAGQRRLSRSQMELIGTTISAANTCFY